MSFQNSVVGGVTLVRPAIQSPNFSAGSAGWAINADGSAEFNNITIRGSGTADPLVVGPAGLPQVAIRTTPTNGLIVFPTNTAIENDAATLNSAVVNSGAADERAELQMTSPTVTGATDGVRVVLRSQPDDGSLPASFSIQDRTGATTFFAVDETEVRVVEMRIDSRQLSASGVVLTGYVTTDAFDRILIQADGEMQWGPGSGARDVRLYREAASVLATDDIFRIYRSATGDNALSIRVAGDTASRLFINADGAMNWGPGGGTSTDTNLYRSAANTLKTDDTFEAANFPAGAWSSWTPAWTTSTGVGTPSFGNATVNCSYTQIGRTVLAQFEVVFGGTTNFGGGGGGDNYRFSLPVTAASTTGCAGWMELNYSTGVRSASRARLTTTGVFEIEVSSGRPDGATFTNFGLIDAITPETWASGDAIRGILMYEAAN